ncbi:MAG TPA: hypothetical protein VK550_12980 [Polyangiaceae bacterium]|jgi:hypothetical protein|nr:hypothetical protein [Polyangiaceae bacterium]
MIRAFSIVTALGLCTALISNRANAQTQPAAPVAPQAAPAPTPPVYGPPPQGEPPPGWTPPPGYAWRAQPMEMKYVDGKPIPAGYHIETRVRKGLVVSGPIIFGVPYLLSMSVAASSKYAPDRWLYAPVVGPFVNLASRGDDCNPNFSSSTSTTVTCAGDSSTRFFLMLDGLMQTAGATMLILGLALPQTLLVRDDAPFTGENRGHFAWTISPYSMGRAGSGLALTGIF